MPKPPLKSRELSSASALKRLLLILPTGIGERHDHVDGRKLVKECIKEGLVRHLFLELPNTAQGAVNSILGNAQMNRALAVLSLDLAATPPSSYNEIHLADLVIAARDAEPAVPVWAADKHAFTRYGFPARHKEISECVKDKTATTGLKGSLFLWGSDHFTSTSGTDDPLWNYIRGMYYFVAKGHPSSPRPTPPPPAAAAPAPTRRGPPPPLPPRRRGPPPPLPPR